jgi:uncharacterized protein (DUF983 family)
MFFKKSSPSNVPTPADAPQIRRFVGRSIWLRCPECGGHPIFVPMRRVRSLFDWFHPLDGCPQCGYAYEREEGYFLLATWVVNYGLVGAVGLAAGLLLEGFTRMGFWSIVAILMAVMPLVSLLFARHSKAIYLAIDHYFDPHRTEPPYG